MDKFKGLFFDVGGTVFDWKNTARERIQELAEATGVKKLIVRLLPLTGVMKCSRYTPK